MVEAIIGVRQLQLFDDMQTVTDMDASLWQGSFNGRESSLQQLSPYVGKLKSGMVRVLLSLYSKPNDIILDPFSGSGVVPLEAAIAGRCAWANDLSLYAYVLTRGKLEAPSSKEFAIDQARSFITAAENKSQRVDLSDVPEWVQQFFHPDTLKETLAAFHILLEENNYFLLSCLLGILHHERPGFLSYPASHLVPYLRLSKYPPEEYPQMYQYRDLRSRLLAKVNRAYRRSMLPPNWEQRQFKVWQANSMDLPIESNTVDTIISSPPYFGALDYARDNRLRLWFLGWNDWRKLDSCLTASNKVYLPQMTVCLQEMSRVLRPGGHCILVLGDVESDGQTRRTAEILSELAADGTRNTLVTIMIYDDEIPDERRSRRQTRTTKSERILVMQKQ